MKFITTALSFILFTSIAITPPQASAETLLIERVQSNDVMSLPTHGMSMGHVEAKFGAPLQKSTAISGPGSRKHNPPITHWVYQNFTVYFEYDHVVSSVLNKASATEIGPAPPQK